MLENIRVVDFSEGVAGALAAVRLAQLGAEVVKVESYEGDWLRGTAPVMTGTQMSATFFALNAGKRSLRLGHAPETAASLMKSLLQRTDVFITDRKSAQLQAMGLDEANAPTYSPNPRLIVAAISAWGEKGPWAEQEGSELTAQAVAGYTRYLGASSEVARRLGADVAAAGTGIFTGQAILAGLLSRSRNGGVGQRVSLSFLNSLIAMKSIHLAAQSNPDRYSGPRVGGANYPPERGWRTRDKNIFFSFGGAVGASGRPGWVNFLHEAGIPRLLDDPRFDKTGRNSTGLGSDVLALKSEYEKEFQRFGADELVPLIRKHAGNAASYQRTDEALEHPQTEALGVVREVSTAKDGASTTRVRAFPARYSRTRPEVSGSAPDLGEHSVEIALELGLSSTDIDAAVEIGAIALPAEMELDRASQ